MRLYILRGHTPVPCADLLAWAQWFENAAARRVAQTKIGGARVSTVFLGIDHRHSGNGPPILFETMIFGGARDGWQERYATWDDAQAGHARAVYMLRELAPAHAKE